jgi:acetyltransferase
MTSIPSSADPTLPLDLHPNLNPFFQPKGIVVIGASQNPTKLGFGLARNLFQSGYRGAIHLVNPKGGTLLEHPVYKRISEVPDPADLAVLLIPAPIVPDSLIACGERGIRAAIIASGGFRETGPDGVALEERCLAIARDYKMRLVGPNCIGIIDTHLPLDTTFLPPPGPPPGDVAFISHSGAICAAVIDWARGQGFGLSRLVSLGNQADVNETDVLTPMAADPHTRVITLYLEGVSDGRRFVKEAYRVGRQKPIIALKVGRFESGQRAVASHTGAMAGRESAFNAAFRRAGVIRAETSEALFDLAKALAWCPTPRGHAVAVLTNAGGPGVTAADALESHGLQLAVLTAETHAALQGILPAAANVQNPVDMLASASPEQYAHCLRILLADPNVDSVLLILPPPPMYTAGGVARTIIPIIYSADKPVVVALMGERMIQEAIEYFRSAKVPEYRFPERAAAALAVLCQRAECLAREQDQPVRLTDVRPEAVHRLLQRTPTDEAGFLPQETAARVADAYGIPVPGLKLAHTADQAGELAQQVGFPVALKVASPDIPHKSDVGGIRLNLTDAAAVTEAYGTILQNARDARPEAEIRGVYVQPMITSGQEVILGGLQDPQFGPLVMFGSGGVEVEGLQDVDFALAPLSRLEAEGVLDRTWAGRKLRGYRNLPPADREATLDALLRLAQLAADFPQFTEIEINPLRVLPAGEGVFAVDVRLRLARTEG